MSPCEDGTKKIVTFAIADWLYNHRIDSVRAKSDLWNKFEIEFYRPMVSELTKYENEDCFKTTLVALYKGSAVVLDGNERETNAIGRSLPSYIYTSADWAYTSHWIDEYAKQTTKKSRILVFFANNFPPLITNQLSVIQNQRSSSVIIVSGEVKVTSLIQFPKHHRIYIKPFVSTFNEILQLLGGEGPSPLPRLNINYPLLNIVRNENYNHYDFLRNTQPRLTGKDTRCLQNKTIGIIYRRWEVDVESFSSFLVQLESLLLMTRANNHNLQFYFIEIIDRFHQPSFSRPITFMLNSNFRHIRISWWTYSPKLFDNLKEHYVFFHTVQEEEYYVLLKDYMINKQVPYIGLKQHKDQIKSPFRDADADNDDVIRVNPSDFMSDEFIDLVLRTLAHLAC